MSLLLAREWLEHDPDPATRAELAAIIETEDSFELADRFAGPLQFGTAGLRGRIGAGQTRMNQATVMQASWAVAQWLNSKVPTPTVVVGCDARHGSEKFYQAALGVFAAAGCHVIALPPKLPTPVTAFAVRYHQADAGIMITASHNPPQDNGYKVYLGGRVVDSDAAAGVQLISPVDNAIACLLADAPYPDAICCEQQLPVPDTSIYSAYLTRVQRHIVVPEVADLELPVVVTAMHGVGGVPLMQVLNKLGFKNVIPVVEQIQPDPDFPTVNFPNPEEPGALDAAYRTADRHQTRLIVALDPDADRCSVAIRGDSGWRQLSGDEVGAILGEVMARRHHGSGKALACSIVSSQLLEKIAGNHGLVFHPALTGFKWIARTPKLVFGFEEALGYCLDPEAVRDKDGISACAQVVVLAATLAAKGRDLIDFLNELDQEYGVYATKPVTVRTSDAAAAREVVVKLKAELPDVEDLSEGYRGLPPTAGVVIKTADHERIIIRPSGTEPKVKCYIQVIGTSREQVGERVKVLVKKIEQLIAKVLMG